MIDWQTIQYKESPGETGEPKRLNRFLPENQRFGSCTNLWKTSDSWFVSDCEYKSLSGAEQGRS